ncbi:MAG: hypothetical protein KGH79_04285 [Patescibacteria group bacterium]|nr:hypothetical protein [Patescibacteria group bacterium]
MNEEKLKTILEGMERVNAALLKDAGAENADPDTYTVGYHDGVASVLEFIRSEM